MATIGNFSRTQNGFNGEINTLTITARNARIVPIEPKSDNAQAPTHRIYSGRAEIGACWTRQTDDDRVYLSVKIDDPSLRAPIYANLVDDEDTNGDTASLIWSRPARD